MVHHGFSDDLTETDNAPRLNWRIVVALFGAAFIARFAYFYLDDLTRAVPGTFARRLLEEGTGNFASLVLFSVAIFAERRFPLDRDRWRTNWLPHVAGFVVYSAAHTTLMAVSRAVLSPLTGLGTYDYGIMSVRYFMEAAQDVFSYVTFVGLLTLIRVQQRLRDREVRAAQLERAAAQARLESLSLRLQPHFLFNALNTISSTVYENPVLADELIGQLGALLRRSLASGDNQETSLADELELVALYEALITSRFGDRIEFEHAVEDVALQCAVPSFLLQPLIENAVLHGSSTERELKITLGARVFDGQLHINVENDADNGDVEPRTGVGLGATRDRLNILYGATASLVASHESGRFVVSIRVPARAPAARLQQSEVDARAHR